jgi:hypothetical protein
MKQIFITNNHFNCRAPHQQQKFLTHPVSPGAQVETETRVKVTAGMKVTMNPLAVDQTTEMTVARLLMYAKIYILPYKMILTSII